MRDSPRVRRLRSDYRALEQLQADSTVLDFKSFGEPPDTYLLRFHGKGLARPQSNAPLVVQDEHVVRVTLGASYPRLQPELAWQTPIFHPNISAGGVVCLGGYGTYWVPSLNLDELCEMLWDMVRYANFDVLSPYNREAAAWAKVQSDFRFPVDPRPIRDRLNHRAGRSPDAKQDVLASSVATIETEAVGPLPVPSVPRNDILFLDDDQVVDAEVIDDDPDLLIIQ